MEIRVSYNDRESKREIVKNFTANTMPEFAEVMLEMGRLIPKDSAFDSKKLLEDIREAYKENENENEAND